jgi:hypothetical protein
MSFHDDNAPVWTPPHESSRPEGSRPLADPYNEDPYYPDPYAKI